MGAIDLKTTSNVATSLAPAARTATGDGTGVNVSGYRSAMIAIVLGAWTDGTHTYEVQESDDDSTYSAVADADLDGTEPVVDAADEDLVVHLIGYKGVKKYVRVSVTRASTSTGIVDSAVVVLGNARQF